MDCSPAGSSIHGILKARTLVWVSIASSRVSSQPREQTHIFFFFLTLQYCIGFAIYRNESATGLHVFPILNSPPSSLPIPSLWVIPLHQPQASSIVHRTWTGDSFHIIHVSMLFSQIIPPSPSPTESKRLFYTPVSLLLSRIQG